MTKSKALEVLKTYDMSEDNEDREFCEALTMAISALEQKPCDDAISRAELLKAIDTWDKFGCDADTKLVPYQDHYIPYIHYDDVIKAIKGMPSVQPSRKGHWITTDYFKFTCSECGWEGNCDTKFCSNCGAEMESEQ